MKQAANALKWAVDEMERRYQMFANAGTKNIATYNGWVDRCERALAKAPPVKQVTAIGADGEPVTVAAATDGSDAQLPDRIPYIVIVVDEFSDLMMQQGKDVETAVARLAQKARAAGMHVILATQRPSVDVITGIIKAELPHPHRVPRFAEGRLADDSRRAGRRAPARARRHARQDERHQRDPPRAMSLRQRGRGPEGHRLPAAAGHTRLRREHTQAA